MRVLPKPDDNSVICFGLFGFPYYFGAISRNTVMRNKGQQGHKCVLP